MSDAKLDMALDDIIKSNRNSGRGNRRGRGGNASGRGMQRQQRRGNNQRYSGGGIVKNNNNNNNRGRGGARARNSFNQRNLNRSNNFRPQRGNRNSIPGYSRRNNGGDKPTATYNPLNRDANQSQNNGNNQAKATTTPRKQQGSVFNKMRRNQMGNNNSTNTTNVSALRRRMVAAQRALTRATKTLAALPRIKQQRQRILQQPQKLRNIITRNRAAGGGVRKRLGTTKRKMIGGRATGRNAIGRAFV